MQAKANQESGKVFEANELLAKKDRQIDDLRRQLSEQASTIHSLRVSRANGARASQAMSCHAVTLSHVCAALSCRSPLWMPCPR